MIKKYFFQAKEKYRKSKLTLDGVEDGIAKDKILVILVLAILSDNKIDSEEISALSIFMKDVLYPSDDLEDLKKDLRKKISEVMLLIDVKSFLEKERLFTETCRELNALLNNRQKNELLEVLTQLLQADEDVSSEEIALLKNFRKEIKYKNILGEKAKFKGDCPACGGSNIELKEQREVDRWKKPKKVYEKAANGNTKTKYVNVTCVKMQNNHQCLDCRSDFTTFTEHEK